MWPHTVLSVYLPSQGKLKLRRKQRNKIVKKFYLNQDQISKRSNGYDFLNYSLPNNVNY